MGNEVNGNSNLPTCGYVVGGKMPDITGKINNLIEKDEIKKVGDSIFCYGKDGKIDAVINNNNVENGGKSATIYDGDKTYYAWDTNCDGDAERIVVSDIKNGTYKYTSDGNGNIASEKKL